MSSLPLRKCGLKSNAFEGMKESAAVTSLAEVWIEIKSSLARLLGISVTSLAEVWIEMAENVLYFCFMLSHFPCGSVD